MGGWWESGVAHCFVFKYFEYFLRFLVEWLGRHIVSFIYLFFKWPMLPLLVIIHWRSNEAAWLVSARAVLTVSMCCLLFISPIHRHSSASWHVSLSEWTATKEWVSTLNGPSMIPNPTATVPLNRAMFSSMVDACTSILFYLFTFTY